MIDFIRFSLVLLLFNLSINNSIAQELNSYLNDSGIMNFSELEDECLYKYGDDLVFTRYLINQ